MFYLSFLSNFLNKSDKFVFYSTLHFLENSYNKIEHIDVHSKINPKDIQENGFLVTNAEKERLLFNMAFHEMGHEKISNQSPLNHTHPGSVLINRKSQTIYKIYHPETKKEKQLRKESLKYFHIEKHAKGVIGKGGFGKIRICQDLITGKWYAVKIMRKSLLEQLCYLFGSSFFYQPNEIFFLKQQNLFIDCIETLSKFYIIEKLIPGQDLSKYVRKNLKIYNSKDMERVSEILLEILKKMIISVESFHNRKYLHRDISVDNFIFDPRERKVYLIDFGFAMKLKEGNLGAYNLNVVGKDEHRAPEIYNKRYYSYASDIYALGITFKCLIDEVFSDFEYGYKFISKLVELASKMADPDIQKRTSLPSINFEIDLIKDQATEEFNESKKKNISSSEVRNYSLHFIPLFNKIVNLQDKKSDHEYETKNCLPDDSTINIFKTLK